MYAKAEHARVAAANKSQQKKATKERKRRLEAESHPNGPMVYWMKYWMRRFGRWLIAQGV